MERRSAAPRVDVRLFTNPTVNAAAPVFFTMQLSKIVVAVFVSLYLQHGLGMPAATSGLISATAVIGAPLVSLPAGRSANRYGARWPILMETVCAALSGLRMDGAIS